MKYVYLSSPLDTTAGAVLADAMPLVRGDRYLTYDFTPFNLTTWSGQLGRVLA
jgi:hypothetical protein